MNSNVNSTARKKRRKERREKEEEEYQGQHASIIKKFNNSINQLCCQFIYIEHKYIGHFIVLVVIGLLI